MSAPTGNGGRFLLALGGFLGFSCAFFSALSAGSGANSALWRGSVGMVIGALLMQVLLLVFYSAIREARQERAKAKASARRPEDASSEPKSA